MDGGNKGIISLSISVGFWPLLITTLLCLIWETEEWFSPPMYFKGIGPKGKQAGFLLSKDAVNRFSNVKCSLSSVQICSLTLKGPKRVWQFSDSQQQAIIKLLISSAPLLTSHGGARGLRLHLRSFPKNIYCHNIKMLNFSVLQRTNLDTISQLWCW